MRDHLESKIGNLKKSSKMTTKKEISPLAVGCTYI